MKRYDANPRSVTFSGPSVFFGKPDAKKITKDHYINKWNLVPMKVDLDRLMRDDKTAKITGVELTTFNGGGNRRRELSKEDIDSYRRTKPSELWKHYSDTKFYAADVPHGIVVTKSGRIPPQYLTVLKTKKQSSD